MECVTSLFEYNLHHKTWIAIAWFGRVAMTEKTCRGLDETERLYYNALQSVAVNACRLADNRTLEQMWQRQNRVTVKLNREVNSALYLLAVQSVPDEIRGLTCFSSFVDGAEEVVEDMKMIRDRNRGIVSLGYQVDQRLVDLRRAISRQCKIVA